MPWRAVAVAGAVGPVVLAVLAGLGVLAAAVLTFVVHLLVLVVLPALVLVVPAGAVAFSSLYRQLGVPRPRRSGTLGLVVTAAAALDGWALVVLAGTGSGAGSPGWTSPALLLLLLGAGPAAVLAANRTLVHPAAHAVAVLLCLAAVVGTVSVGPAGHGRRPHRGSAANELREAAALPFVPAVLTETPGGGQPMPGIAYGDRATSSYRPASGPASSVTQ